MDSQGLAKKKFLSTSGKTREFYVYPSTQAGNFVGPLLARAPDDEEHKEYTLSDGFAFVDKHGEQWRMLSGQ